MIIDITERKAAEQALRASEERWKFALEGAGDGVWDRDIQTDEVLYSKRYKEMLGYAENEFANRRDEWEKRIHPEDKARVMADLRAYLEGAFRPMPPNTACAARTAIGNGCSPAAR